MPGRPASIPQLTDGQANFVLTRLIRDRRVSAADVRQYLGEVEQEISELENRLNELRGVAGSESPARRPQPRTRRRTRTRTAAASPAAPAASDAPAPAKGGKKRRRLKLTPARRAELKLQGHYLALMRQIPARRRPFYRSFFKAKGHAPTIAALRRELKK